VFLVACLSITASSVSASPAWPSHKCGSFQSKEALEGFEDINRITVFNGPGVSCKLATALIQGFWGPEENITQHGGPSDAESFYTVHGFRGWRCYQGAGAGSCRKHGKIVAYTAKNA
jgi:hypothetical protein